MALAKTSGIELLLKDRVSDARVFVTYGIHADTIMWSRLYVIEGIVYEAMQDFCFSFVLLKLGLSIDTRLRIIQISLDITFRSKFRLE